MKFNTIATIVFFLSQIMSVHAVGSSFSSPRTALYAAQSVKNKAQKSQNYSYFNPLRLLSSYTDKLKRYPGYTFGATLTGIVLIGGFFYWWKYCTSTKKTPPDGQNNQKNNQQNNNQKEYLLNSHDQAYKIFFEAIEKLDFDEQFVAYCEEQKVISTGNALHIRLKSQMRKNCDYTKESVLNMNKAIEALAKALVSLTISQSFSPEIKKQEPIDKTTTTEIKTNENKEKEKNKKELEKKKLSPKEALQAVLENPRIKDWIEVNKISTEPQGRSELQILQDIVQEMSKDDSDTPLFDFMSNNNLEIMRILLEAGLNPFLKKSKKGILFDATKSSDMANLFMDYAKIGKKDVRRLQNFIRFNDIEGVRGFLKNYSGNLNQTDDAGHTILWLAVVNQKEEIENLLRDEGADLNQTDINTLDKDLLVQEILHKDITIDELEFIAQSSFTKNKTTKTIFEVLIEQADDEKSIKAFKHLLPVVNNDNENLVGNDGHTLLYHAINNDNKEIEKFLRSKGAGLNKTDIETMPNDYLIDEVLRNDIQEQTLKLLAAKKDMLVDIIKYDNPEALKKLLKVAVVGDEIKGKLLFDSILKQKKDIVGTLRSYGAQLTQESEENLISIALNKDDSKLLEFLAETENILLVDEEGKERKIGKDSISDLLNTYSKIVGSATTLKAKKIIEEQKSKNPYATKEKEFVNKIKSEKNIKKLRELGDAQHTFDVSGGYSKTQTGFDWIFYSGDIEAFNNLLNAYQDISKKKNANGHTVLYTAINEGFFNNTNLDEYYGKVAEILRKNGVQLNKKDITSLNADVLTKVILRDDITNDELQLITQRTFADKNTTESIFEVLVRKTDENSINALKKLLLSTEGNKNPTNQDKHTLLYKAIINKNDQIANFLRQQEARLSKTDVDSLDIDTLIKAILNDKLSNTELKIIAKRTFGDKNTTESIFEVLRSKNETMALEKLLATKVDNKILNQLLVNSIRNDQKDITDILKKKGVKLNQQDVYGLLITAVEWHKPELLKLLKEEEEKNSLSDEQKNELLFKALDKKIDLNTKDFISTIGYLVDDLKANLNAKETATGNTLLLYTAENHKVEHVLKLLRNFPSLDFHATNNDGENIFHILAGKTLAPNDEKNVMEIFKILLEKEVQSDATNNAKQTPLDIARSPYYYTAEGEQEEKLDDEEWSKDHFKVWLEKAIEKYTLANKNN